ncbi:hypothetical protein SODALDRAFT_359681 [Sodiomyces alkalinus F11]|uniref:Fe2OG dioxygenase domain-containing protein n=1 Tax=Sodiomyces alkalinus (strain CBS 110278 / VKM F-3762 / F11) TaxID=1314773 RepID=A0A3N2PW35_SODAK|nr:hypothetical protein SODALDRAFT_359681 [Sodiomyces alkalinus F11]ROT38576.1 hypothetical protein SODALDRAFT_359681 [Sodiomyces alkalinus F11]
MEAQDGDAFFSGWESKDWFWVSQVLRESKSSKARPPSHTSDNYGYDWPHDLNWNPPPDIAFGSTPFIHLPTRRDMASEDGSIRLPESLNDALITRLPPTAFYIPDFISDDLRPFLRNKLTMAFAQLLQIAEAPKPRWKQLTHRRLQTWPSDLVQNKLIDAPLPPWLETPIVPRILSLRRSRLDSDAACPSDMFSESPHQRPNHVLINEYPPGIGIMPHKASISLGASLCLNLYRSKEDGALDPDPAWRIFQEPRSLLITTDSLYTDYLHGIADVGEDVNLSAETVANWDLLRSPDMFTGGRNVRGTRTSLTYRDVMKVTKLGPKFSLLGKPRR